jgi:RecA/RadA recombinase
LPEKILSTRGLNTLMFSDPYAKLCFTARLVSQFDKASYIDLDTIFTAYFNAGLIKPGSVDIYLPSEGRLVSMIKDVIESMGKSQLVVFDSVNSFYNLFPAQVKTGDLNHLLSVLLMLLVRRGFDENIPVLATSMLRYRKDRGWVQSPASRRLLKHRSAARLSVERSGNDVAVTVVEHDSLPAGTQLIYKDSLITV